MSLFPSLALTAKRAKKQQTFLTSDRLVNFGKVSLSIKGIPAPFNGGTVSVGNKVLQVKGRLYIVGLCYKFLYMGISWLPQIWGAFFS